MLKPVVLTQSVQVCTDSVAWGMVASALATPRYLTAARLDHPLCTELPLSCLSHRQGWVEGIFLLAAALPRQRAIIRMAGLAWA